MNIYLTRKGHNRGGAQVESSRAAILALIILLGAMGIHGSVAVAQDPGASAVPGTGQGPGAVAGSGSGRRS